MKTALQIGPLVLAAGLLALWFTAPQLARSVSSETSTGSVESASSQIEMKTRGPWVCPTESCNFRNLSGGNAFRSVVHQECPFWFDLSDQGVVRMAPAF